MARNRKDRQEAVDDSGELVQQDGKWYKDVIEWNGVWLKRIPHEEAFRIRCDVQLYIHHKLAREIRMDNTGPEGYRKKLERGSDSSANRGGNWARALSRWWTDYVWYIEVADPTKEEYVSDDETD